MITLLHLPAHSADITRQDLEVVLEDIVAEAEQLVANGVKELIVIAQDTTQYGGRHLRKADASGITPFMQN